MTLIPYVDQVNNPKIEYLADLDNNMSTIIKSKMKPDKKVKLYNQDLDNMMIAHPSNSPLPIKKTEETPRQS